MIGVTALLAAVLAQTQSTRDAMLLVWVGEAVVAGCIGLAAMVVKSRRAGVDLARGAARKFVLALMPSAICAAAVSLALAMHEQTTADSGGLVDRLRLGGDCGGHAFGADDSDHGCRLRRRGARGSVRSSRIPERAARTRVRWSAHRLRPSHRATSWRINRENRSASGAKRRARGNAKAKKPEFKAVIGHLRDEGGAEVFRLVNERVRLGILSALAVTEFLELRRSQTDARRHRWKSEHSRAKARRGGVHFLREDVPGSTSAYAIHADAERTRGVRTLSRPYGGIDQSDAQTDMNSPVRHLGIIMDGNRRWATRRGLPASLGHRAGVTAARTIVESLRRREVPFVTLYAFSSDNWRRSSDEVGAIFGVLDGYLSDEIDLLVKQRIRVQVIGRRDRLPARTRRLVELAETRTAAGDAMLLAIGGRLFVARRDRCRGAGVCGTARSGTGARPRRVRPAAERGGERRRPCPTST